MTLTHNKRAIGVFAGYQEAENALNKLQHAGFAMNQVSVIAKDADLPSTNRFDQESNNGNTSGVVVGGLAGLLMGMGIFAISGIGSIVLAGTTATTIATTLAGGAIATVAGGLIGGLIDLGIPEEQAKLYHNHVVGGDYLVIVDGTEAEIVGAGTILRRRGIHDWKVYSTQINAHEKEPSYALMKL